MLIPASGLSHCCKKLLVTQAPAQVITSSSHSQNVHYAIGYLDCVFGRSVIMQDDGALVRHDDADRLERLP